MSLITAISLPSEVKTSGAIFKSGKPKNKMDDFDAELRSNRINLVVLLLSPKEGKTELEAWYKEHELDIVPFPIEDGRLPETENTLKIVENLYQKVMCGNKLLIQDRLGTGRSGIIVTLLTQKIFNEQNIKISASVHLENYYPKKAQSAAHQLFINKLADRMIESKQTPMATPVKCQENAAPNLFTHIQWPSELEIAGKIFRSQRPWPSNEEEFQQELKKLNVTTVVILLSKNECFFNKDIGLVDWYKQMGLKVVAFHIQDFSTPKLGSTVTLINDLIINLLCGENVLVHCMGGNGRTGTVLACLVKSLFLQAEIPGDPLTYVRKYIPKAAENTLQESFVRTYHNNDLAKTNYISSSGGVATSETVEFTQIELFGTCKGNLFRSARPMPQTREAFEKHIKENNITRVLVLLEDKKSVLAPSSNMDLFGFYFTQGLAVNHFSIPDSHVPTMGAAEKNVRIIRECLEEGENVLVHCEQGIGRTGLVIGCLVKSIFKKANLTIDPIQHVKQFIPNFGNNKAQSKFIADF